MDEWNEVKAELLKNPKVLREYKKLEPKYRLISQLIAARVQKGMTQNYLARKLKTKQSAIARLESSNTNPTFDFLNRIATALEMNLSVQFQ